MVPLPCHVVVRIWGGATLNWSRVRPLTDTGVVVVEGSDGGGGTCPATLPQPVTLMSAVSWAPPAQYNPERRGWVTRALLILKIFQHFREKLSVLEPLGGLTGLSTLSELSDLFVCFLFFPLLVLHLSFRASTETGGILQIERYDWQRLSSGIHQIESLIFNLSVIFPLDRNILHEIFIFSEEL